MALQKINWTQIDSANIPSGSTVNIGSLLTPVDGVYTNVLFIADELGDLHDFFYYLTGFTSGATSNFAILTGNNIFHGVQTIDGPLIVYSGITVDGSINITGQYLINGVPISFSGGTGTNFVVPTHSGLELISGTTGNTLTTSYNTTLDPSLATPATVGGITAGTTVAQLSGKTFVEFVDELLFPVVLPTYTIPTINISGVASQTLEIGSTFSANINVFGDKNDAGSFTQLRILRNTLPLSTYIGVGITPSSIAAIPNQFGYTNPNNPNFRYTINASPYSEVFVIPTPGGSSTSTSTIYNSDGNYSAGLPKNNNKGSLDVRTALIRSVNTPQSAGLNFSSSISTITGIFPYFWGTSLTLPNAASIAATIAGGLVNKILLDASGSLSIPYNMPSGTYLFIWIAYYGSYGSKTKWFVTTLDSGDINNTFITTATPQIVNSPDGYWTNKAYKMHWSINPTTQNGNFIYQP